MVLYYEQEMKCWRELKDQVCTELRSDDIDYALGTSWNMSQNERKAALPAIKLTSGVRNSTLLPGPASAKATKAQLPRGGDEN